MSLYILQSPLDLMALLAETEDPQCGALAIFAGTVRNENDGQLVQGITYEANTQMAERVMAEIELEARTQFGVTQCRAQHRIGYLALGEISVVVVVRAGHRPPAFAAARYVIDEVKKRVPIWKEEHYVTGNTRYLDGTPLRRPDEP
jgi:molybdopterin synthase catalytic subunit